MEEILNRLIARKIEGMMFHDEMTDYFQFLGLQGFKRLHAYRFLCEAKEMRKLKQFEIDHCNVLPEVDGVDYSKRTPSAWYGRKQTDVDESTRQRAVRDAMVAWVEWEKETREIFSKAYTEALEKNPSGAVKIAKCLKGIECEVKYAERLNLKLAACGYSMDFVIEIQDKLHDEFKK